MQEEGGVVRVEYRGGVHQAVLPCPTVPWLYPARTCTTVTTRWLLAGGRRREETALSKTSLFFTV